MLEILIECNIEVIETRPMVDILDKSTKEIDALLRENPSTKYNPCDVISLMGEF